MIPTYELGKPRGAVGGFPYKGHGSIAEQDRRSEQDHRHAAHMRSFCKWNRIRTE